MNRYIRCTGLMLFAVVGCGDGTPAVRYGQDACSHCRMIINDGRFAAAASLSSGETLEFDDVCCLIDGLEDRGNTVTQLWVRGYQSGQWHDAKEMFFVYGPKLQTPMGSGLAAVTSQQEADALAKTWEGKTMRYGDLTKFLQDRRAKSPPDSDSPDEDATNQEDATNSSGESK